MIEFPKDYASLSAFQRQGYIDRMRVEVADLQVALEELNAATPPVALSNVGRSLLPVPTNLGLRLQKTLKISKNKVLGLQKFGGTTRDFSEPGFVTTTQDGVALLWDAATGLKFEALRVGKGSMMCVSVNDSCRVAAAGGLSCAVDVYTVGQQLRDLTGDTGKPFEFTVSKHHFRPNDSRPEQFRLTLSGHDAAVSSMQFLTETLLASASQDGGVFIWDVSSATTLSSSNESSGITAISRSSDNIFCTAATDGKLKVWDVRTRASEAQWFALSRSLANAVFMPEGQSVLTSDESGMSLFDLRTSSQLETYKPSGTFVTAYDVSASGRIAFVGTDTGITVPLDLLHNRVLEPLDSRRDRVSSVKVVDGIVLAANWDGSVRSYSRAQDTKK